MSGEMVPYVVRQGDYLVRLGWIHGFDPEVVWKDPKNEELKKLRGDHNILAPGDVIYIPAKQQEGLPIEKGATNKYVARVPKVPVHLRFEDASGPLANARFVAEGGATPAEGSTDGDGRLRVLVSVFTPAIDVRFPDLDLTYHVRVGHLDPVKERSGAISRLAQLGYLDPFLAGDPGNQGNEGLLSSALQAFQEAQGLDPTGALDEATQEALRRAHGG